MQISQAFLDAHLKTAFLEDIGDGDHSSLACIDSSIKGKAVIKAKESGIIAGLKIAESVFNLADPTISFNPQVNDGDLVKIGDTIIELEGSCQNILKGERLALNYLQRMSGIATQTNKYVSLIADTDTKILDTRKTTPNMRFFEKLAVKIGGGENHRFGLYDMIMLKDNHIDFSGGITKALQKTKQYLETNNKKLPIEIETRTIDEVKEVISVGIADRIMLDNFSIEDTKHALQLIDNKFETESSGGINLKTVRDYALCGVDFISVGALTHQISSLDLSLIAKWN